MITTYIVRNGLLTTYDGPPGAILAADEVLWHDMQAPTLEEEHQLETLLGVEIPTREEMEEIEVSSRLYTEGGAFFLTASVVANAHSEAPQLAPVTFILSGNRLVTVRYHAPRSFATFRQRAAKADLGIRSGTTLLIAIFETVTDRLADILEAAARRHDDISRDVFVSGARSPEQRNQLSQILERIGQAEDMNAKIKESLATLDRVIGFFSLAPDAKKGAADRRSRIKTVARDLRSLADYANAQTQKITFLLDATLGMVNIEQNGIIKIFSVAAVVFLPPTLIASIYGMNFRFMPELDWQLGYPFALGLQVLSAVLPYLYFKRKGWL
ncbi:MAG: magnesium transporter CorA family protein [Phaeovulum sp.]|uniref:magnesium transporter CorA family protein n=1 Tax=Phaeovulum sp. TaxID=2934796 RepID=UPI0027376500|nr:magnesium transporter CorA family protein [Phaeovulum sp.]MDP3860435.1 magnesium transporter CorA family protein [Phaeovulum sp.]